MPEYRVCWEIDVDAATPEEAARQARKHQLEPDTIATVFDVRENRSYARWQRVDIDLHDEGD